VPLHCWKPKGVLLFAIGISLLQETQQASTPGPL